MSDREYTTQELKWVAEAEAVGITWLHRTRGQYSFYRLQCGHTQEITNNHVRRNNFRCRTCLEQKWKNEANNVGITWLCRTRKDHGLYKLACGHEQELLVNNIRTNTFGCQTCKESRWKDEAESVGITWLYKTRKLYGMYRLSCGHEQELSNGNVRNNQFRCQTCEDYHWTLPSQTYVFKITVGDFSWLKVGYAKSPENRKSYYGLPPESTVELLHSRQHPTGKDADRHESELLYVAREWHLDPLLMQTYHTKSGATECFDLRALPILELAFQ